MKLGPFKVPGYHVGDCRELLRQLPDASVNCVVTSPPYWALRDYGTGRWEGGDPTCVHARCAGGTARSTLGQYDNDMSPEVIAARMDDAGHAGYRTVCKRCGARRVDRQIGLEETPADYVTTMVEVFREVRRVLRDDGTCWVNLGDTYASSSLSNHERGLATPAFNGRGESQAAAAGAENPPRPPVPPGLKPKDLVGIPWRVAFALQADGWWLRSDVIWSKPNPMPESVTDRPTKAHEYLFLLTKSAAYHYNAEAIREPMVAPEASTPSDLGRAFSRRRAAAPEIRQENLDETRARLTGKNKRSVWTIPSEPTPDAHFATFPRKLVEPCILAGCPAGGVVLDPFGGSGTVGRVAEDLGRRWILFDLNPEYARIAKKRTAQTGLLTRAAGPVEAA